MKYEFFTNENYVSKVHHISASEKILRGKTDPHFHEFFEIELITEGNGRHEINGNEKELKKGSIYFLPPGNFHRIFCTPELNVINIMFDESIISSELQAKLLDSNASLCAVLNEEELSDVIALAKQLIEEINAPDNYTAHYSANLLDCILIKIMRKAEVLPFSDIKGRYEAINTAINYLYKNFKDAPTLDELAKNCGYSPNYFRKLFIELTGKCYTDFVNALKVSYAKVLLASNNMTVSEIAFDCGFTSLSNFYRVFHNETGHSPLEYRNKIVP